MKRIILMLAAVGLGITGLVTASAQYYSNNNSYDYGAYSSSYTSTSYSYPETSSYYYGNYGGSYGHGNYYDGYTGGVGSYTIGCTTYYYNTRTGSVLYTSNICPTYNYTYPSYYYTYPSYPSNQYCTYGYHNGSWNQCQSYGGFWNNYNNGYQNYLNCYYDQYGRYICY